LKVTSKVGKIYRKDNGSPREPHLPTLEPQKFTIRLNFLNFLPCLFFVFFCEPTQWCLAHCSFDKFQCCCCLLLVAFFTNYFKFLYFLKFRFEIWHTPPAPQCVTFAKSASTSDHHVARDRLKSAGLDSNMLMRFWQLQGKLSFKDSFGHSCSCPPLHTSLPMIFGEKKIRKTIEIDKTRLLPNPRREGIAT
jgi:hypothetical protein